MAKQVGGGESTQVSNKERKRRQKAAYHAEFQPHKRPRSRRWEIRGDPKVGGKRP